MFFFSHGDFVEVRRNGERERMALETPSSSSPSAVAPNVSAATNRCSMDALCDDIISRSEDSISRSVSTMRSIGEETCYGSNASAAVSREAEILRDDSFARDMSLEISDACLEVTLSEDAFYEDGEVVEDGDDASASKRQSVADSGLASSRSTVALIEAAEPRTRTTSDSVDSAISSVLVNAEASIRSGEDAVVEGEEEAAATEDDAGSIFSSHGSEASFHNQSGSGAQSGHYVKNKRFYSASEVRYYKSSGSLHHGHVLAASQSPQSSSPLHGSPSSKSVKSLSALTPTRAGTSSPSSASSSAQKTWMRSFQKSGRKMKKRSLNALFDAVGAGKAVKQRELEKTVDPNLSLLIPRANSASEGSKRRTSKSSLGLAASNSASENCDDNDEDLNTLQLTRLATSDLRDLERRFHSSERVVASPPSSSSSSPNNRDDAESKTPGGSGGGEDQEADGAFSPDRPAPHPQAYFTIDSRRLASKHKKSLRDKKLLYGVKQFNLEPSRGIRYLTESGFLKADDPKAVADFLFREGRLSKKQIGKFLGGHDKFNQEVLRQFVRCHQFTHLILVQALRQFLWSFRLPGEAMQIDRVMEAFAGHYCEQNPNLFDETDTCYVISFSIIMLNTALHNPNVKQKITVDQFVRQNRGINSGKDLPRDILELIYRSIKEEPFKIPDETYDDLMYTFFSPEREGWLMKQGGSWKNWKRRWFVLSDRCLYYFQHTAENVPKGIIPLENVKVRLLDDVDGKPFCFEVYSESNSVVKGCKTDSRGTVVQGNHRSYRMSAASEEDRADWVRSVQESVREHPFTDIIAAKKAALLRRNQQVQQVQPGTPSAKDRGVAASSSSSTQSTPVKKHHSSVLEMLLTPKSARSNSSAAAAAAAHAGANAAGATPTKKPSESAPDLKVREREVV